MPTTPPPRGYTILFWSVALVIIAADFVTKQLALAHLVPGQPQEVIGNAVRWTLAFNTGAAFSMSIGSPFVSRLVFGTFAAIALFVLWRLYWTAVAGERLKVLAASLAFAGAAGNLIDRLRWSRGVVDFIDIGTSTVRFWTFNVADSAVTVGAILLAIVLWQEDRKLAQRRRASDGVAGQEIAPDGADASSPRGS